MAAIHSRDRLDILGCPAGSHGRSYTTDSFQQGLPRLAPCHRFLTLFPRFCLPVYRFLIRFGTPAEDRLMFDPSVCLRTVSSSTEIASCITFALPNPPIVLATSDAYWFDLCCRGLQHFPTLPPSYMWPPYAGIPDSRNESVQPSTHPASPPRTSSTWTNLSRGAKWPRNRGLCASLLMLPTLVSPARGVPLQPPSYTSTPNDFKGRLCLALRETPSRPCSI